MPSQNRYEKIAGRRSSRQLLIASHPASSRMIIAITRGGPAGIGGAAHRGNLACPLRTCWTTQLRGRIGCWAACARSTPRWARKKRDRPHGFVTPGFAVFGERERRPPQRALRAALGADLTAPGRFPPPRRLSDTIHQDCWEKYVFLCARWRRFPACCAARWAKSPRPADGQAVMRDCWVAAAGGGRRGGGLPCAAAGRTRAAAQAVRRLRHRR